MEAVAEGGRGGVIRGRVVGYISIEDGTTVGERHEKVRRDAHGS